MDLIAPHADSQYLSFFEDHLRNITWEGYDFRTFAYMLSLEAPGGTGLEVFDYFRAIRGGEVSGFLADGESFNITQYDIYARKMQKYVKSHRETYVPGNLVIHRGDRHHRPLP